MTKETKREQIRYRLCVPPAEDKLIRQYATKFGLTPNAALRLLAVRGLSTQMAVKAIHAEAADAVARIDRKNDEHAKDIAEAVNKGLRLFDEKANAFIDALVDVIGQSPATGRPTNGAQPKPAPAPKTTTPKPIPGGNDFLDPTWLQDTTTEN